MAKIFAIYNNGGACGRKCSVISCGMRSEKSVVDCRSGLSNKFIYEFNFEDIGMPHPVEIPFPTLQVIFANH